MNNPNISRSAWLQGPSAACSVQPEANHPWRLILRGAPGVGKGTQADLLHQRLHACHLCTGDVFRAAAQSNCEPSPAMTVALDYMRRGALVPDSTVWEMVRERAGCLRCRGGFILDGFPRTLSQAESLAQLMKTEGWSLVAVVNYELPIAEIVDRLSGRRTCDHCKTVYPITGKTFADRRHLRSLWRPPLPARRRPNRVGHRPHGCLPTQHRAPDRFLPPCRTAAFDRGHRLSRSYL
jgi:adenylate kinase